MPSPRALARLSIAILAANLAGYGAWHLAILAIPRLWAGRSEASHPVLLVVLISATFIMLAAPPVLVGAAGAWLAQRAQPWVGLASGLWSLSLLAWVPPAIPIARGLWYAPTVLVLLSGLLGGYMLDWRQAASTWRQP